MYVYTYYRVNNSPLGGLCAGTWLWLGLYGSLIMA